MAKYGHVMGHKQERPGASDWYRQIEEAHIRKVEAEWQARQRQATPPSATYHIVISPFSPWVEGEVFDTRTGRSVFVTRLQLTAQEAREICEEWIEEQAA